MTSEVENIVNGTVVGDIKECKALGIGTQSLMPNEKGIIPLSSQNAFILEPVMTSSEPVEEEVESFDLTSDDDGVIKDAPIEVTPPTALDGFTFGNTSVNVDQPAEEVVEETPMVEETPAPTVEMPAMEEEVLAQAPTEVDNNLFADAPAVAEAPAVDPMTAIVPSVDPMMTDAPAIDTPFTVAEPTPMPAPVVEEEVTLHNPMTEEIPAETAPFGFDTPAVEIAPVEETKEEKVVEEAVPVEEAVAATETPAEEPQMEVVEETTPTQQVTQPAKSADEVTRLVEEFRTQLNKSVDELEKNILNADLNKNAAPEMVEETKVELPQTEEIKVEETPLEGLNFELPQTETLNQSFVAEEVPQVEDEMVDALSQLGDMNVSMVDDTPIQGGKFI